MSEMWEQHKPFTVAVIVWLAGSLLFLLAVHLPLSGPVAELRADVADELKKHYAAGEPAPGAVPFEQAERAAQTERARLDAALAGACERIEFKPQSEFTIAPDAPQRAYEYTKIRDKVAAELRELANKASLTIPGQIDPRANAKNLPRESEADELLFRLAMTDRVIRNAAAARVAHIVSMAHELGPPRGAPFAERRLGLTLVGELDEIVRFIERCSSPPAEPAPGEREGAGRGVLAVQHVEILAQGRSGSALTANLTLAAIEATKITPAKPRPDSTRPIRRAGRSF